MNLVFIAPAFGETYIDLPLEKRSQFESKLLKFLNQPSKLQKIIQNQRSTLGLSDKNFYKLFIDKKHHSVSEHDTHLIYDRSEEPGYYSGMKNAFAYLSNSIHRKLDFDELVYLHDIAVEGVLRIVNGQDGAFLEKGVEAGWFYKIKKTTITQEAKLDWFRYKLIYLDLDHYSDYLSETGLFHDRIQSKINPVLNFSPSEVKAYVKNLSHSHQFNFHTTILNQCFYSQSAKLKQEIQDETLYETERQKLVQYWFEEIPNIFNKPQFFENTCVQNAFHHFIRSEIVTEIYYEQKQSDYLSFATFEEENYIKVNSNLEYLSKLISKIEFEVAKSRYSELYRTYQNEIETHLEKDRNSLFTLDAILRSIAILARAQLIFHILPDGNGRTCVLLINKLLMQNHLPPVILEDPHDFTGIKGTSELVIELKNGIYNYLKEVGY